MLFISRHNRDFDFDVVIFQVVFPICTLTWRVSSYVSRQGKGVIKKNESTGILIFCYHSVVLIIIPNIVTSNIKKIVKQQFDFSSVKTNNYQSLTIVFPVENGNS